MVAPAASHSRQDARPEAADLLVWYDRHRRALPWRALPGEVPDPYRVWLSEIMLQQTTVTAVKPYFARFLDRFPDVAALAAAPEEAVMSAWAGLGYYSRARNLHACARAVAAGGGIFPDTVEGLRKLPGIGAYTAGAIAAIAFDRPAAAVDGNVERVVSRLFAVDQPLPAARPVLRTLAESLVPQQRPGDFAQAVMDLGATLCTPKRPACALCPWMLPCEARREGTQETYPRKLKKEAGALRKGAAFVVQRAGDGAILLRTRPPTGLLGAMAEPPTSEWRPDYDPAQALLDAPLDARWKRLPGTVRHVFTHFPLELTVFMARVAADMAAPEGMRFTPPAGLADEPLPGAMKKVLAHALDQKLALPSAPKPEPEPDLATPPPLEPAVRRAPIPKVLSRRPIAAAPPRKGQPKAR